MRKPLITLVLAVGLGAASLTGCASPAPSSTPSASASAESGQSTADACKIVSDHFTELQDELASAQAAAATGDYSQAVTTWTSLQQTFTSATDDVSNSAVKDALNEIGAAMTQFTKVFDGVTNGDLTVLTTKGAEFQAAATAMQSAGGKLSEVCTS